MTYPPEKSSAPAPPIPLSHEGKAPIQPPPQMLNAFTEYTMVIHSGTKSIQALKLVRPRIEPASRMTVIAANTNWKYASAERGNLSAGIAPASSGIEACPCRASGERIVPG